MLTRSDFSEVRSAALEVCEGGHARSRSLRRPRRLLVVASCLIAGVAPLRALQGQAAVHTYYVNDGKNNTYDNSLGEFAKDLGGHVPWWRYHETAFSSGHYFARAWSPVAPQSFAEMMYDGALDLDYLNGQIGAWIGAPYQFLPFTASNVFVEPGVSTVPIVGLAWWNATASLPSSTPQRQILYWPYKLNGGSVMICMAGDGNGAPARPAGDPSAALMLYNYPLHLSAFGTNKNRWRDFDGQRRRFSPQSGVDDIYFAESGWPGPTGSQILGPQEQAIEAGDVVVFVQENFSMGLWIALQRTLEAEWFTRNTFAAAPPGPGGPFPAVPVGHAYLAGGSFGEIVSMCFAMLQPKIYGGTTEWIMNDFGFGLRDHGELQWHVDLMAGRVPWGLPTDSLWSSFYNLVDLLGVRFDAPKFSRPGWDVAAFSVNRRPTDLKVPLYGSLGDIEYNHSGHWPAADKTLPTGGNLRFELYRNTPHESLWGYIPGVNEFSVFTGNEWATLKASGAPAASNSALVPTSPAPSMPFPDPYSHTLRHVHVDLPSNPPLLSELDLHAGLQPPYRKSGLPSNANLNALGQGIWPGFHDSMHVLDLDGDGRKEVVFGNFDGYVHVLEFNPSLDPSDPYRLYDEWRSPYLGWGLVGNDSYMAAGKAQMFFGASTGQIWRINATGADTYQVANGGQPFAVPGPGKELYPGATPIVLVNDFAFSNAGNEVLVMNRFFDWSLIPIAGGAINFPRLERSTRIVGATDAFPVNLDNDPQKELLVSAADGVLWMLDFIGSSTIGWANPEPQWPANPFTNLALSHVVPCTLSLSAIPTHVLLFGRNDDLDDATPGANTNVIELRDMVTGALVTSISSALSLDEAMCFAWVQKPPSSLPNADFSISDGGGIETYRISTSPAISLSMLVGTQIFLRDDPEFHSPNRITSLEQAMLSNGSGGTSSCLIFTTCKGRVFVLDAVSLAFLRDSTKEMVTPVGGSPVPWPSNRTVAGTYACDLVNPSPATGGADFYFAEYAVPAWSTGAGIAGDHYRVGSVKIGSGTPLVNQWNPYVPGGTNVLEAVSGSPWDQAFPDFNRTLLYRDLDGVGGPELRIFAETGTAFLETRDAWSGSPVREFQTASFRANFIAWSGTVIPRRAQGGRIFERPSRSFGDYLYLGGFTPPADPTMPYKDSNGGQSGWWHPVVSSNFLTGQVASCSQSVFPLGLGTSMKKADLRRTGAGATTPHVVIGTNGGYVYAIEPGLNPDSGGNRSSHLSYVSRDLGTLIVGLDVGNLDADVDEEIVCGSWIDTGTFVDWQNGVTTRNRAHLYVLDPNGVSGGFDVTELDGDAAFGIPRAGIGSGVSGVKIDDVNGDGVKEIWCGDAVGHVYLFSQKNGPWTLVYRSKDLCPYPGFYNNLHPIKDAVGKTVKLLVNSPGYAMLFQVDPAVIP